MFNLARMNNNDLELNLKDLVSKERKLLHIILEHIKEVDSRRVYLERAYSSMYEYLMGECGYSGSAAIRRLEAARLLRDIPSMAQKIESGDLNLSQIGEFSRAVKEKEKAGIKISTSVKEELLAVISGRTTQETQRELAVALDIELKAPEKVTIQKDGSARLEVSLPKDLYEKLLACRDHAATSLHNAFGDSSWVALLASFAAERLRNSSAPTVTTASVVDRVNNSVTPRTKRLVLKRDGCCQFKDARSGKVCGSTYGLEVDHKMPQWSGGSHSTENLQILCKRHNDFKYKKEAQIRFL